MSAPEKRMAWALVVGALVTGLMAGDTNNLAYNWLVGIVPGAVAWLTAWILLEGVAWNFDAKQSRPRSEPVSNVRRLPNRYTRGDDGVPE